MFNFTQTCSDTTTALWGLFDFAIAPPLLFYAYIPILSISLFLGILIYKKEQGSLLGKLFFGLTVVFALLLLNEILQWVAAPVALVMIGWQLIPLFRILVSILTVYFVSVFITKKDVSVLSKLILSVFYCSVLVFTTTSANISSFDLDNCEAIPSWLWNYVYLLSAASILWIIYLTLMQIRSKSKERRKNVLLGFGAASFLAIFFAATIWGDVTTVYEVALIGPIGMLVFTATITFLIIRYNTFNIKLAAPVALVLSLWVLVFSLLFVYTVETVRIIVSITLVLVVGFGLALIRSVRREIKQREQLEILTKDLEKANDRLKELDKAKSEFVSIASHQLRSPLTSIRGYASMLAEESFGKLPQKALEAASRIEESAKLMAMSVEDYLNVSRIESGNMKYNLSDFNIRDMADKLCDDLRPDALKHNLILLFRTDLKSRGIVNADVGKTNQIIHNLINNSIKYTPKGTVNVFMRDDLKKKRIYIDITDTGIGMSQATMHTLFQKFSRADNANSVNVSGTGLGLFVAFKMAEAMGGTITCSSDGDGKGSTFTFELPLAM